MTMMTVTTIIMTMILYNNNNNKIVFVSVSELVPHPPTSVQQQLATEFTLESKHTVPYFSSSM